MNTATVINTPYGIAMWRILSMKSALKLECLGLKNSRGSVYALVKHEFGFKGNKQSVLTQLENYISELQSKETL